MTIDNSGSALSSVITWAAARRVIYGLFVIAGIASTAIGAAFVATGDPVPKWYLVAVAVLGSLTIPIGSLALANVTPNARVQVLEASFEGTSGTVTPARDEALFDSPAQLRADRLDT